MYNLVRYSAKHSVFVSQESHQVNTSQGNFSHLSNL